MRKRGLKGEGLAVGAARVQCPERWRLTEPQLQRVTALMLEDLSVTFDLVALAAACGFSRGHFIRAFKQTTGLPPYRWLLNERVRRACALLDGTSFPVADIALQCGFSDQAHLTRIFSKLMGISPAAWRRRER